jgi:DegV family protein with EDD domain
MIRIVTDSTAYLSPAIIEKHGICVVPLCVHFGAQAFQEGVDLSTEEFYARLAGAAELPTTSQPSPADFYAVMKDLVDAGDELIVLTISSKLSGTWNSAMAALEMLPQAKISVVDSLSASIGLQMMVEAAAEAAAAGSTRAQIVELAEEIKQKLCILFVVDTLEYLAKGGRIGNAKALLGTLLKVKPILTLHEGAIEPLEQVRSKRKAVARMLELVEAHAAGRGAQAHVAVTHALVPDEARLLAEEIQKRLGCAAPSVSDLGGVIGTHTGPGVVAVGLYL